MQITGHTPSLRLLLNRADLRLRLQSDEAALEPGALDLPVRWVHSSDLVDPTPFLSDGLVLLTTGTQFAGDGKTADGAADDADDIFVNYVRLLRLRGVAGLGFGTDVVRAGVPPQLVEACRTQAMPLFEVPYKTPFIAVARANAEAVAAESFARRNWALSARRAIALAALRPEGLTATVTELARQLRTWVGMFDASGALTRQHPEKGLPPEAHNRLQLEVMAVLRRGSQAGTSLRIGETPFTLLTLGRGGKLQGVLAIAGGDLDQEGRGVVTSVIAMAGLAFEQHQELRKAREQLRAALVQLLLADSPALARRISHSMGTELPAAPIVVAVLSAPAAGLDVVSDALELRAQENRGRVFFGRDEDQLVVVVPASSGEILAGLTASSDVRAGVSDPAPYDSFSVALRQARVALEASTGSLTTFADVSRRGVLAVLASDTARALALDSLAPLLDYDAAHSTALLTTLRVWLDNDTSHEATSAALGVHRHTVRARIGQVESVLGIKLGGFAARAELWVSLRALGDEASSLPFPPS